MAERANNKYWRAFRARLERERPGYLAAIENEITERGPLAFGDLSDPARREKIQTTYAASTPLAPGAGVRAALRPRSGS